MRLLVDSREKKNNHILKYFDSKAIEYQIKKLNCGDYAIEGFPFIAIERKQNLSELSKNLTNKADRSRFYKEVRRAREQGVKLYILCEHGGKVKSIQDVAQWSDKYSGVSGRALMEALYKLHIAWGVEIIFCSKRSTGKRIIEILSCCRGEG